MAGKKIMRLITIICVLFLATIFILPVFLTVMASFIDEEQIAYIFNSNPSLNILSEIKLALSSYDRLLFDFFPFYKLFWNSVIYSTSITFFALLVGFLAAFSFYYSR